MSDDQIQQPPDPWSDGIDERPLEDQHRAYRRVNFTLRVLAGLDRHRARLHHRRGHLGWPMTIRYSEQQFAELVQRNPRLRAHDQTAKTAAAPAPRKRKSPKPTGAPRKDEVQRKESPIEALLAYQIHSAGLPEPKRNYLFLADRKCELDFAWPELKVAIEVQGMVHRIKRQFKSDIEKKALALLAGCRVLEVGGDEIRSGQALAWVKDLLKRGNDGQG